MSRLTGMDGPFFLGLVTAKDKVGRVIMTKCVRGIGPTRPWTLCEYVLGRFWK